MLHRLTARATVLASVALAITLTTACYDATGLPGLEGGGDVTGEDTAFLRGGNGRGKSAVSDLEIQPSDFTLAVGSGSQLRVVARSSSGRTVSATALWSSSDPDVATVTDGTVQGIAAGSALITASANGVADTAVATVTAEPLSVDSVVLSPAAAHLVVGESLDLSATPVSGDGDALVDRTVSWSSSDTDVAMVSESGHLTGVAPGDAVVTATSAGVTATAPVTVAPVPAVPVASVAVTPSPASLKEGATLSLHARLTDAAGAELTDRAVTWTSSNEGVASVSGAGVITGVAAGNTTITASVEGREGTTAVTVTASTVAVASITMSAASATMEVGGSVQLIATPKDAAGNELTGRSIAWTSSNASVAAVSASGLVTGVGAGSATITAASEGRSATSAMTVSAPAPAPAPPPPSPTPTPAPVERVGYYVSPSGSSGGAGTKSSPWDLASVLGGSKPVAAGDTVWVLGGTYRGQFINYMNGNSSRQIVVRQYPGQRATIDGNLVVVGSYVTFWGLEIMNSDPIGTNRLGINNRAPGSQFINLVVHDHGASGVGIWIEGPGSMVYGSLVYNNGTHTNQDHGIYANNDAPVKLIEENIIFNNQAYGLHAYASTGQYINNFLVRGNVSFNNGTIWTDGWRPDLFVGGATPAMGIVVDHNFTYRNDNRISVSMGYSAQNGALTLTNNYFVGQLELIKWTSVDQSGTTLVNLSSRPSGTRVFVRPNRFERGRAHITVYNWAGYGSVSADVSGILQAGDTYEIRNAQNFYGQPVASGTFGGGSVTIPITAITPVRPIGRSTVPAPSTGTEFGVYVLLKTN